jgi:hypothetical protein
MKDLLKDNEFLADIAKDLGLDLGDDQPESEEQKKKEEEDKK